MFDPNDLKWKNPENLSGPIVPGHPDYVAPSKGEIVWRRPREEEYDDGIEYHGPLRTPKCMF